MRGGRERGSEQARASKRERASEGSEGAREGDPSPSSPRVHPHRPSQVCLQAHRPSLLKVSTDGDAKNTREVRPAPPPSQPRPPMRPKFAQCDAHVQPCAWHCAQVPHITVMVRGVSPGEIATLVIEQCRLTIESAFPGLT